MSVDSWMKEFYPTTADTCRIEEAVAHSLRKWSGLTQENMQKHGVRVVHSSVCDDSGDCFGIDGGSCALCVHYFTEDEYEDENGEYAVLECVDCPLAMQEGYPCDADNGPYRKFIEHADAEPMIKVLKRLAATEKSEIDCTESGC